MSHPGFMVRNRSLLVGFVSSWSDVAVGTGPSDSTFKSCRSGVSAAVTSTATSSVVLMCRGRRTAGPDPPPYPAPRPGFDQINDDIDALPTRTCCVRRNAPAAMRHPRLRNIEAYLTGLAGAANTAGDSGTGAGTTLPGGDRHGRRWRSGSGMVNTANALPTYPRS